MKSKLLIFILGFLSLNNISADNGIAKKFIAAFLAGPTARTLLLENIPAGIISPALKQLSNIEEKNEHKEKNNKIKWISRMGCLINSYILYSSLHTFYTVEDLDGDVTWVSPNHDTGRTFVGFVLASLGLIIERELVDSLKKSKVFKGNKEVVDIIEPAVILSMQILSDKVL